MKQLFFTLPLMFLLVLTSCDASKKGSWNQSDKDSFNEVMAEIDADLSVFGDKKQAFIDCYFEKCQSQYNNFAEADADYDGLKKLSEECARQTMQLN